MRDYLPYLVVGLSNGSIYGIAAMGLVLTYKTSGLFNFAHGAVAATAGYVFYELRDLRGWPWPVAAAVSVLVLAPILGLAFERLARRLGGAPLAMRIVGTIGLLAALTGLAQVRYGAVVITMRPFLPTTTARVLGVNVGYDQAIVVVLAAVAAATLYIFFNRTRVGLSMRAVVEDPSLLALGAVSPTRVRSLAWAIGFAFAAVSGLLLGPTVGLDANILTLLVVYSFGAAAVGAFSSLPLAYAGGVAIGVAAALSTKYVVDYRWMQGLPPSLPFIVLFVVLLVMPRHRLVSAGERAARVLPPRQRMLPRRASAALAGLGIVVLLLVPELVDTKLPVYTNGIIFVILFLSLRLLVRTSGQVSLCHATFAAVGAAAYSHLSHGLGLPWPLAMVGTAVVAVPVGAIVAIPAIRLSGLHLAIATFGFGILVERLFFGTGVMFGAAGARVAARPDLPGIELDSDTGFYYVCVAVALIAIAVTATLSRGRLGRLLLVLAESPLALTTNGASANVVRVLVFTISAAMAAVAGALFGQLTESINGVGFGFFQSLQWLTVLVLAGSSKYASAFIAAALTAVLPSYGSSGTEWTPVVYGVLVVLIAGASGGLDVRRLASSARFRARLGGRSPVRDRVAAEGVAA